MLLAVKFSLLLRSFFFTFVPKPLDIAVFYDLKTPPLCNSSSLNCLSHLGFGSRSTSLNPPPPFRSSSLLKLEDRFLSS